MDGDDGRTAVQNRGVEMREMHEVEFFFFEDAKEFCLFGQRIMRGVDQDFFHSAFFTGGRGEVGKFRFVEKQYIFVLRVRAEKIFREFINIPADAGKTGGVHSAVDADAHWGSGMRR